MCHPGRPGPHGEGQAGSPGLACFHTHEVERVVLELVDLDARARARLVDPSSPKARRTWGTCAPST